MFRQPKADPLEASDFFDDGGSSRTVVANAIPRGGLRLDKHFFNGTSGTNLVATFPFPISRTTLERGRERFDIYCAPCHGRAGEGNGMVVQRGFPAPPSYHSDRLRDAPVGHFYGVITHGYGIMSSYAQRVDPPDRWAIVAYIRALQLSRHAKLNDVPPEELEKFRPKTDERDVPSRD
jgi:mono/diheme cytochrome c family protein